MTISRFVNTLSSTDGLASQELEPKSFHNHESPSLPSYNYTSPFAVDHLDRSGVDSCSEHSPRRRKTQWNRSSTATGPPCDAQAFFHEINPEIPLASRALSTQLTRHQQGAHLPTQLPQIVLDQTATASSFHHLQSFRTLPFANQHLHLAHGPPAPPGPSVQSTTPMMFVDCVPRSTVKLEGESTALPVEKRPQGSGDTGAGGGFLFVNQTSSQPEDPSDSRQNIRSFVMCRARKARLWSTSRKKGKLSEDAQPSTQGPSASRPKSSGGPYKAKGGRAKRQKTSPSGSPALLIRSKDGPLLSGEAIDLPTPFAHPPTSVPLSPAVRKFGWPPIVHSTPGHESSAQLSPPAAVNKSGIARSGGFSHSTSPNLQHSSTFHSVQPPSEDHIRDRRLPHTEGNFPSLPSFGSCPTGSQATVGNSGSHLPSSTSSPPFAPRHLLPSEVVTYPPAACSQIIQHHSSALVLPSPLSSSQALPQNDSSLASSMTSDFSISSDIKTTTNARPKPLFSNQPISSSGMLGVDSPTADLDPTDGLAFEILRTWVRRTCSGIPVGADPLSILPIQLEPRDIRLLYLFAEVLSPISVPLAHFGTIQAYDRLFIPSDYPLHKPLSALAQSWLASAFTSKAFLYSLLCSITVFDYLAGGDSKTNDIVYYHVNAVTAISEALNDRRANIANGTNAANQEEDCKNTLIGTVWQLLCIQEGVQSLPDLKDSLQALSFPGPAEGSDSVLLGVAVEEQQDEVDFRRAHNDGFLRMLELRGGIKALAPDSCLQAMLLWHQALHSVSALQPFAYTVPRSLIRDHSSALRDRGIHVMEESTLPFGPTSPLLYLTDLDPPLPNPLVAIVESAVSLTRSLNQWFEYNARCPTDAWKHQDAALELQIHVSRLLYSTLNWMAIDGPALETHDFSEPTWTQVKDYRAKLKRFRDEDSTSSTWDSRTSHCTPSSSCSVITIPPVSGFEVPSDEHLAVLAGMDLDQSLVRPSLHQLHKALCLAIVVFVTWNTESADSIPQESSVLHYEAMNQAQMLIEDIVSFISESGLAPSTAVPHELSTSSERDSKAFIARAVSIDYPLPSSIVECNMLLWILTVFAVAVPPSATIGPLTEEQISACKRFRPVHQPLNGSATREICLMNTLSFRAHRRHSCPQHQHSHFHCNPSNHCHPLPSSSSHDYSILDSVFPSDRTREDESSYEFILRVWRSTCLRLGIWSLEELRLRLFTSILPSAAATLAGNEIGLISTIPDKTELRRLIKENQCPLWIPHRMDHSLEQLWVAFIEPALPDCVSRSPVKDG